MGLPVIIINDCWEYIIELELEHKGLGLREHFEFHLIFVLSCLNVEYSFAIFFGAFFTSPFLLVSV